MVLRAASAEAPLGKFNRKNYMYTTQCTFIDYKKSLSKTLNCVFIFIMADGRVGNKVKYNILLLCHTKESVVYSTEKISVTS